MADQKRPPFSLPAMRDTRMPARGSVHLPADSGAWWGSPTTILKKNAAFVRAHADYLDARTTQARSGQAYVDACHELARSIARLDWLPDVLEADYLRGKLDRAHEIQMLRIAHATAEAEARITLARTEHYLASLRHGPEAASSPHSPPQPAGLTPDEVEEIIASLPEASDELRRTISLLLKGRLKEKQG
jgi:hypothetical protein